jgi:hypothetical protein
MEGRIWLTSGSARSPQNSSRNIHGFNPIQGKIAARNPGRLAKISAAEMALAQQIWEVKKAHPEQLENRCHLRHLGQLWFLGSQDYWSETYSLIANSKASLH